MSLGQLQYLTLLAVARLGTDAYAREIREVLREVAGRDVSVSTVFVTLTRLEDQGLLSSRRGDPPPGGGRRVRIFALTEEGWDEARAARDAAERMWRGLEPA